ncbi:ABC transporter permease [Xylocopilactobacillus apis]|uniref:Lantibiotic ABC transporter permease n=1 Tax=Xylocopilactobacillus apis TaxID=2932183 RepID=A0AAU9D2S8_9LACO|nr:ABC transporter permease [Xylocopilactobacillus apis]BDR56600.1 lantibiotic ABC transporter permease [Xylocopilactobacillus apis]
MKIIHSEIIKFFSNIWCVLGLIGTIIIAPLILFLHGGYLSADEVISISLRNLFIGQAGLTVFTSIFIGQEYMHSQLRTSLITVPSRFKLFKTKFLILIMISWLAGLGTSIICLAVGAFKYQIHWTASLAHGALIILISWTLIVVITASLAVILRSQAASMAIMFSLILGFSQMIFGLTKLAKYLPDLAVMNLFLDHPQKLFLSGSTGLIVQFSWAFILTLLAFVMIEKRDVN